MGIGIDEAPLSKLGEQTSGLEKHQSWLEIVFACAPIVPQTPRLFALALHGTLKPANRLCVEGNLLLFAAWFTCRTCVLVIFLSGAAHSSSVLMSGK